MAAGRWRSSPVASVVAVILVVAAASSKEIAAVAGADETKKPTCKLYSDDVRDVVHSIVNSPENAAIQGDCKTAMSRVRSMGDDCLCEFMRVVQARFERPIELSPLCVSPGDMPTCPPPCIVTQATVDRFAKEIQSAGPDFRESAVCKDMVSELMKVSDDCFCQLRSRVQKKVDIGIDDALCATPATISRCPRTGKEPTCSIQDDDVQYCVKALVPGHGLVKELVGVVEDVVDVVTGDEPPSVAGCCSKVKAQGRACACEFRRAIEQQLIGSNGDLDAMRPCLGDAGGDDGECPAAPPVEEQPAGCRITERDVFAVAEKVRIYNVYSDDLCEDAVSRVRPMGPGCLCELRDRAQALFDDMDVERWSCIRASKENSTSCKPPCVIREATVEYVATLVGNTNAAQTALICSDAVWRVTERGDHCLCELRSRVQEKVMNSSIDDTLSSQCGISPRTMSRCPRTGKEPVCVVEDEVVKKCVDALMPRSDDKPSGAGDRPVQGSDDDAVYGSGGPSRYWPGSDDTIGGPGRYWQGSSNAVYTSGGGPSRGYYGRSSVSDDCCSKVKQQGSTACVCEFRHAVKRKLIERNANETKMDMMDTMMGYCMLRDDDCPEEAAATVE
ncbi:hypothetical protein ACP4OV_029110 [Aristida adscensionis]